MTVGPTGPPGHQRPAILDGLRTLNAGNRGPFTLDGTRTFLVGQDRVAVVDPGPADEAHVAAVAHTLADASQVRIVLTHGHADHAGAAAPLAERIGAQVWGPVAGGNPIQDGDRVPTDAGDLLAVSTPGHTRDHLCFWWTERMALFAGDLLLGDGSTTWVAEYPGCVADYLRSLDRVDRLGAAIVFPAHGGALVEPRSDIERFRSHRLQRIDQVRTALRALPSASAAELIDPVYGAALPAEMRPAAEASLDAILWHLEG